MQQWELLASADLEGLPLPWPCLWELISRVNFPSLLASKSRSSSLFCLLAFGSSYRFPWTAPTFFSPHHLFLNGCELKFPNFFISHALVFFLMLRSPKLWSIPPSMVLLAPHHTRLFVSQQPCLVHQLRVPMQVYLYIKIHAAMERPMIRVLGSCFIQCGVEMEHLKCTNLGPAVVWRPDLSRSSSWTTYFVSGPVKWTRWCYPNYFCFCYLNPRPSRLKVCASAFPPKVH